MTLLGAASAQAVNRRRGRGGRVAIHTSMREKNAIRACPARISRRLWGRTTSSRDSAYEGMFGSSAGENDDASTWRNGSQLNPRVKPVLGDHRLVAKSPEGSRQPDGSSPTYRTLTTMNQLAVITSTRTLVG
jgi:hypothetical protein